MDIVVRKGGRREEHGSSMHAGKFVRRAIQIAGAAAKVGLYIGTGIISAKAIVRASEIAQGRLVIPGGEIFTIPLIVALFLVGWALRGDVERTRRQWQKEQQRRWRNEKHI